MTTSKLLFADCFQSHSNYVIKTEGNRRTAAYLAARAPRDARDKKLDCLIGGFTGSYQHVLRRDKAALLSCALTSVRDLRSNEKVI